MNSQIIAALTRHVLTAISGGLFIKYGVDGGTAEAIIGSIAALAGVSWSIYDKKKSK